MNDAGIFQSLKKSGNNSHKNQPKHLHVDDSSFLKQNPLFSTNSLGQKQSKKLSKINTEKWTETPNCDDSQGFKNLMQTPEPFPRSKTCLARNRQKSYPKKMQKTEKNTYTWTIHGLFFDDFMQHKKSLKKTWNEYTTTDQNTYI